MNRDIRRELEQSTAFTLITLPFNNREWSKTNANIYQVSDYYCRNAGNDMLIDKHVNLFVKRIQCRCRMHNLKLKYIYLRLSRGLGFGAKLTWLR